jgi:hypothetical protein
MRHTKTGTHLVWRACRLKQKGPKQPSGFLLLSSLFFSFGLFRIPNFSGFAP